MESQYIESHDQLCPLKLPD